MQEEAEEAFRPSLVRILAGLHGLLSAEPAFQVAEVSCRCLADPALCVDQGCCSSTPVLNQPSRLVKRPTAALQKPLCAWIRGAAAAYTVHTLLPAPTCFRPHASVT